MSETATVPSSSSLSSEPTAVIGNKILVIGGPQVGKKHIVRRLLNTPTLAPTTVSLLTSSATAASAPSPSSAPSSPPPAVSVQSYMYPISTRYYSATLHLQVLDDSAVPAFSPASLSALLESELLAELQGVVLVYDAATPQSLRAVQRWSAVTRQLSDDDSVMLMVGVEREHGKAKAELWAEARDWSIDHGIEHVRLPYEAAHAADAAASQAVEQRQQNDDEDEEEEGVPRIAGAFQANQWQHMQMKDRAAAARARLHHTGEEEEEDGGEALSINARLAQEEEQQEAELEAHLQAEEEEERRRAEEQQNGKLQAAGGEKQDSDTDAGQEQDGKSDEQRQREEEEMERHLSGFEAMFERMRSIRQDALNAKAASGAAEAAAAGGSQGAAKALSDVERRKRAEDAIFAMLKQMGLEEEDEQEEAA